MIGLAAPEPNGSARPARIPSASVIPAAACALTIAVVAPVVLATPSSARTIAVPVFVVGAIAVFGVGLSGLARARTRHFDFARGLTVAGLLWVLTALSLSHEPTLYDLGRASQWLVDVAIVYLILSYPSGRLTARTDRGLCAGAALITGLLYLPPALVGHSAGPLVTDRAVPLREALTVGVSLAVAVAVLQHARNTAPLLRLVYAPIALIAVVRALALGLYFPFRYMASTSSALSVLIWAHVLLLPALALAYIAGRLHRRLVAASALERVEHDLGTSSTAAHVTRALADALEDPSLRLLYSYQDGSEQPVASLPPAPAQAPGEQEVTEVASRSGRLAILHAPGLAEDRALVQTVGSYALAVLENDQLINQLRSSRAELAESRAWGVAAIDGERVKIERDLHDGGQQRLIAIAIKLELTAEQLEGHDKASAEMIRALETDIDETIDELRSLARGVYPALLATTGLGEALRAVGRSAALPTTVHADRVGRYRPEIETTVYFSCSEALQNAAKHARGATGVTISAWQDEGLHFQVRDDGAGFELHATPYGTGLSNLRARLAAVGGALRIHSASGQGTTVEGSIPIT
jgi:signal transduction histidine kinase